MMPRNPPLQPDAAGPDYLEAHLESPPKTNKGHESLSSGAFGVRATSGPGPSSSAGPQRFKEDQGSNKMNCSQKLIKATGGTINSVKPDGPTFAVLVVEDTPVAARALSAQLKCLGCSAVVCENGEKAVEHVNSQSGAWYPLILMDYHMPVMDGIECTRAIRRLEKEGKFPGKPAMYILGLSADTVESTSRACLAAGMDRFAVKPLPFQKLSALVAATKQSHPESLGQPPEGQTDQ